MPDSVRLRDLSWRGWLQPRLMPSLRQILSQHGSLLVLDTAATTVQVGQLEHHAPARWAKVETEAGNGVFQALAQLGVAPRAAGALAFCEGPGSILGIRTTAVILATWREVRPRPIFAYRSLELLAATIAPPGATVIADARRQRWHALSPASTGGSARIERLATADLPENLATPVNFRSWTAWPDRPITRLNYHVDELWSHPGAADAALWRETAQPDAFLHEEPHYVTWTPAIHRASEPTSTP